MKYKNFYCIVVSLCLQVLRCCLGRGSSGPGGAVVLGGRSKLGGVSERFKDGPAQSATTMMMGAVTAAGSARQHHHRYTVMDASCRVAAGDIDIAACARQPDATLLTTAAAAGIPESAVTLL